MMTVIPSRQMIDDAMTRFRTEFQTQELQRAWRDMGPERDRGVRAAAGIMGELVFKLIYPHAIDVTKRALGHDFLLKDRKIEIKTNVVKHRPHAEYHVMVRQDHKRDADFYYFIFVKDDLSAAWAAGWARHGDVFKPENFRKKGDQSSFEQFKYTYDCHELRVNELEAQSQVAIA